jgi:hypothetical protein
MREMSERLDSTRSLSSRDGARFSDECCASDPAQRQHVAKFLNAR